MWYDLQDNNIQSSERNHTPSANSYLHVFEWRIIWTKAHAQKMKIAHKSFGPFYATYLFFLKLEKPLDTFIF